jgi:hypothetical protein
MPRYVILEHDHPHLHWDLMLETRCVLRTWRLDKPPCAHESSKATAIGDHRLAYLDFEGKLTNNRGTVKRWDAGTFEGAAFDGNLVRLQIKGNRLIGNLELARQDADEWAFLYFSGDAPSIPC